jgi:excisionase family DNA binding protein
MRTHKGETAMNETRATFQPRLMNVGEAAQFLRLAPKTLYSLVSQRRIPYRKAGRRLLFLESDLISWTQPPERKRRMHA